LIKQNNGYKFKKIYIEITNQCNFFCSFCPNQKDQEAKSMSIEQVDRLFEEISRYTGHICLHVKGEPLLHPQLREIINIAQKNLLKINLTTNGSLIDMHEELLLNSKAIRQISFSLQSIENYKTKNEKQKYLNNIFRFTKKTLDNTEIYIDYRLWNIKQDKRNYQELLTQKLLDENGLELDYEQKNTEIFSNSEILKMIAEEFLDNKEIIEGAYEGKGIKLLKNLYLSQSEQFQWPDIKEKIINDRGYCYGLKSQIAILADGTVIPCCLDEKGIIDLGNIFKETLQDILNSNRAKEFSKGFSENKVIEELCKRCGFRQKFNNTK